MKLRIGLFLVCTALLQGQPANNEHWVASWTTALQLARTPPPANRPPTPPAAAPAAAAPAPVAAPAQTPRPPAPGARGFSNQTVRMMVRASLGGTRLRVKLANAFGAPAVAVGAAHVALHGKDSEIVAGSDRALTFNGQKDCTLGPGMVLLSDPVDLKVAPLVDLAVSLYFPGETGPPTTHGDAMHTTYISKEGDFTAQASLADAATSTTYYFLAGVDVMAPADAALIVAYGDSITDGIKSTIDGNHSWPTLLAARLAARKETAHFGVANMGISGNRVLRDGAGSSALARFDRDVLSQSGVKWVILLEGINDIGTGRVTDPVTVEQLAGAYQQMIEQAHTHGIKVIGCTLTPFLGAPYQREAGEPIREAVNQWIRTSGAFDAVIDFDAATRDAANPKILRADFDPGDHLHPNDAGYQAMADAIDLALFTGKQKAAAAARR